MRQGGKSMASAAVLAAAVLGLLCLAATLWGEDARAIDGLAVARHDLKLGFSVAGRVARVHVKRGDAVRAGQVLIELDDDEVAKAVAVAELRADSDLGVQARQYEREMADLDERRLLELRQEHAATPVEVERAQVNAKIARLNLDLAHQQQQDLKLQLQQAQARHRQYRLLAPRDGLVEMVTVEAGESVEADKPVLRLVVVDPLLVEVWVPLTESLLLKVGDPLWVRHRLDGHDQWVAARVVFVAALADAASDSRLVQAEMPNTQRLPGGGPVSVRLSAPPAQADAPANESAPGRDAVSRSGS